MTEEKFKKLLERAENGDAEAQYEVGMCFYHGDGVESDKRRAASWIVKSANRGFIEAECLLAYIYQTGDVLKLNYARSIFWWKKAAKKGNLDAQYELAWCYLLGRGCTKNPQKGINLLEELAVQGHAWSIQALEERKVAEIEKKDPKND